VKGADEPRAGDVATSGPETLSFAARLEAVQERIAAAFSRRERDIEGPPPRLIAVSKRQPVQAIEAAHVLGQVDFGENYAQEFRDKLAHRPDDDPLRWHFIGQLQRNKIKYVAGKALIHTVDRPALLEELHRRVDREGLVQEFLVEVNSGEAQKGGVGETELGALLDRVPEYSSLRCVGLMTMAPALAAEDTRPYFRRLRNLRDAESRRIRRGVELRELSMGMSADFEVAVEEGATFVRVGSAIFGERPT